MILTTHTVEDFDRWWGIFTTKGAGKRAQHGSKGSQVFRDPNDDARVWVVFDWDEEGFQGFVPIPTCQRSSKRPDPAAPRWRSSPGRTTPVRRDLNGEHYEELLVRWPYWSNVISLGGGQRLS